jgi:hypothetical protein
MGRPAACAHPASTSIGSPWRPATTPDVLRLENLDTDIPPPAAAMEPTPAAIGEDDANSWLPVTGRDDLKKAVAAYRTRVVVGVPDEDLAAVNAEMQRRRDETLRQLDGLPVVRPAGTWSLLAAAGDRS